MVWLYSVWPQIKKFPLIFGIINQKLLFHSDWVIAKQCFRFMETSTTKLVLMWFLKFTFWVLNSYLFESPCESSLGHPGEWSVFYSWFFISSCFTSFYRTFYLIIITFWQTITSCYFFAKIFNHILA